MWLCSRLLIWCMFNPALLPYSQRPPLIQVFHSKHLLPHPTGLNMLGQHPVKRKRCCLIIKHVQCIQKLGLFLAVFTPRKTTCLKDLSAYLMVRLTCSRCPWCCQHCRRGTKAPRPVSQQPVLFLASSLTWTPQSCSPQLEHWTLRMKSLLLTTGAMTLPQAKQTVQWKPLIARKEKHLVMLKMGNRLIGSLSTRVI